MSVGGSVALPFLYVALGLVRQSPPAAGRLQFAVDMKRSYNSSYNTPAAREQRHHDLQGLAELGLPATKLCKVVASLRESKNYWTYQFLSNIFDIRWKKYFNKQLCVGRSSSTTIVKELQDSLSSGNFAISVK